ncbi:hypothetical protein AMTR_s00204p00024590 [Amborella trichopoda]|uniref:Uncharacterized protein n=1 Tax=Amborella trichopoda TaxID=13333 RepID=W1P902_AMBTC|nr:hypothetical protein AMTR_s00204p00024590 [Amborella trichopoda]
MDCLYARQLKLQILSSFTGSWPCLPLAIAAFASSALLVRASFLWFSAGRKLEELVEVVDLFQGFLVVLVNNLHLLRLVCNVNKYIEGDKLKA